MRLLLLAVFLLLAPVTARSQSLDDSPPVYVAGVYDKLANGGDYDPPDALYTPRLLALWKDMEKDIAVCADWFDQQLRGIKPKE